jgi:hypothetical protein
MAEYAASGLTKEAFAEKVGVSGSNLSNWRKLSPRQQRGRTAASFRAVEVESEAAPAALSLRGPGGVVIEGLSIRTAAELIAALSGSVPC